MQSQPPPNRLELAILPLAVLAAFALSLPRLLSGFGFDELYTVHYFIRGKSLWEAISTYRVFNNHLGFTAVAYLSQSLFGLSEWSVRLPALLLGLAAIPATWLLGRRLVSWRVGLLTAALVALSPALLATGVAARGYSGMVFLTLCSTLLFFDLLESPRRTTAVLYVLATALAAYFHLYAVCVVAVQGLVVGALALKRDARARLPLIAWLASCLASVVLYAPVLQSFVTNVESRGRGAHSAAFALDVLHYLGGGAHAFDSAAVFLLAALGWWGLWRSKRLPAVYFLLLLALPLAGALLVRPYDLYPRFFVYAAPYYLLCAAAGIDAVAERLLSRAAGPRRLPVAALGLVLVLAGAGRWVAASRHAGDGAPRYREAIAELERDAPAGTRFAIVGRNAEMMAFYARWPFATPETLAELEAVAAAGRPLRCAYLEHSWNRRGELRIRDHLARQGRSRPMGGVTLFFLD